MEVTAEQLRERYDLLETEELVYLHRNSELTEVASSVLLSILASRGINRENLNATEEKQVAEENDAAHGPILIPLPKIWFGYLIAAIFFVYGVAEEVLNPSLNEQISVPLTIIALAGSFYWLYCVQRLHQILSYATNATYPIPPWKAVAFHFFPFFNIYWIFKWPNEIANYVNSRTSEKRMKKGWIGIVILLGILIKFIDSSVGLVVLFSVSLYLNKKIKSVLEFG